MSFAAIDVTAFLQRLAEGAIAVCDRSYLGAYRLLGGAVAASLVVVDDAVGDVVGSWNSASAALLLLSAVLPSAVPPTGSRPTSTPSDRGQSPHAELAELIL